MTQNKTLTDNEAFEKWFDANRELYDDNSTYDLMQIAWVAAKHESAKEIAEVRRSLDMTVDANKTYSDMYADWTSSQEQITELQSQVNTLRESLTFIALLSGNPKGERRYDLIWEKSNEALKQIEVSE